MLHNCLDPFLTMGMHDMQFVSSNGKLVWFCGSLSLYADMLS